MDIASVEAHRAVSGDAWKRSPVIREFQAMAAAAGHAVEEYTPEASHGLQGELTIKLAPGLGSLEVFASYDPAYGKGYTHRARHLESLERGGPHKVSLKTARELMTDGGYSYPLDAPAVKYNER